ncbi:MAG: hypothetical protein UU48_C0026G0003 [Candidatus Uhrbacteria bacterium GW2011_GWF2_41_16]|uniref:Uncharacterized protein n=1 Tax=Candidatus Uhrbacteria bacterium GW2011_GWF2_41_16 TaxID=1618997 RepID=A0A0G0V6U1_9BACT|nr:MAG: hypothetical protein UU48_C0026G0003 [Candidatus Uhrbacteria bacterium GW2011_GWF2_41_16]
MRDSLRNPFHHPEPNKGTSSELTRRLLSSADNQALTEALGEEESSRSEPQLDLPPADISMSGEEQREVEKEPYWTREQYIEWAEEVTEDKSWIDETFKFQPDGTTIVEEDLNLEETGIICLPVGLMEVKGVLDISRNPSLKFNGYPKKVGGNFLCNDNNLVSPQGMPEEVGGYISIENSNLNSLVGLPEKVNFHLDLSGNKFKPLEGLSKEIGRDLNLTYNYELDSLEVLRGTKIGNNLNLCNIHATEIPEGIRIGGVIYIREYQTDLIADAKRKGYQVILF